MTIDQLIAAYQQPEDAAVEPECLECGDPYQLDDGAEPGPLCHPCAQAWVARLIGEVTAIRAIAIGGEE